MAAVQVFLLCFVLFYLSFCDSLPTFNANDWVINVNKYALHQLVKRSCPEGNINNWDITVADSVLGQILKDHKISEKDIEKSNVVDQLLKRVREMHSRLKSQTRRGSFYTKKEHEKWQKSDTTLKIGSAKRKLENELERETKRRKTCDQTILEQRNTIKKMEKERNQIIGKLVKKTKKAAKKVVGTKTAFSKSYCKKKRKDLRETADATVMLLKALGIKVTTLGVADRYGNKVELKYESNINDKAAKLSVDKALHLKDSLCISDMAYKRLAKNLKQLPSLKKVKKRAKEIDDLFPVQTFDDMIGAWQPLREKIKFAVDDMRQKHKDEPVPNEIVVKISGDGTRIGKRIHCVNITFRVVYGQNLGKEHILAMVRKPEKYKYLCKIFEPIMENLPNSVEILGKDIKVKFCLGADLKFLNEMMGLGACSSTYSCLWCKCPSNERYNCSKKWSMIDLDFGARTVEEIVQYSQGPKKKNMGCLASPILPFISVCNVVPDPLHLFLRISDQLTLQLIQKLQHKDNLSKHSKNVDKEKCKNILAFEEFVNELSIPWAFYTDKESAKLQFRDFTGPEHIKIQRLINLENLIPWHPKLDKIKWLWAEFRNIMDLIKTEGVDPEEFESRSREWVKSYAQVYQAKDVTPYMHVLMNHISDSLKLHGNLTHFSQQAMEKLNDTITSLFFRSTNHRNTEAFIQVVQKQNRLTYLSVYDDDDVKYKVSCSRCGKQNGHNKRTCPDKYKPNTSI